MVVVVGDGGMDGGRVWYMDGWVDDYYLYLWNFEMSGEDGWIVY